MMSIYKNYIQEISERKTQGLKAKPIDDDQLLAEVISQIKDDIVLDVRNPSEIIVGKIKNSLNIPLTELNSKLHKISKSESYSIYCAGGYRSVIAASILMSKGFKNVKNIYGGFKSIAAIN